MSYAVRNTLILLVTLLIIGGSAYAYIEFVQKAKLEELEETHVEKQQDFNSKKATSDSYPELNRIYKKAVEIVENYDKALYPKNNPDDVYDYINVISSGNSQVFFGFTFADSLVEDQYGIVNSRVSGIGEYANFVRFINKLENSQLLNKVRNLKVSPAGGSAATDTEVSFSFNLESYYQRIPMQDINQSVSDIVLKPDISTYNPFYPLIRSTLPPNEENLVNVEASRLVGLSGSRIFIIDQSGDMQTLSAGDEVYLGILESIDSEEKSATFKLNKGGITELVTLEIAQ